MHTVSAAPDRTFTYRCDSSMTNCSEAIQLDEKLIVDEIMPNTLKIPLLGVNE